MYSSTGGIGLLSSDTEFDISMNHDENRIENLFFNLELCDEESHVTDVTTTVSLTN